jgi:hypothetical protein
MGMHLDLRGQRSLYSTCFRTSPYEKKGHRVMEFLNKVINW